MKLSAESEISSRSPAADTGAGADARPGAGGLGGLADMFRNMGGGAGGMPDLASLMSNPALMSMAQQMAQSGGLDQLVQDPSVADMVSTYQRGYAPSHIDCLR